MKKLRVYELARELNLESHALVEKIKELGVSVSSYQSVLNADQCEKIRKQLAAPAEPVKKRVVIKRRKKAPPPEPLESAEDPAAEVVASAASEGQQEPDSSMSDAHEGSFSEAGGEVSTASSEAREGTRLASQESVSLADSAAEPDTAADIVADHQQTAVAESKSVAQPKFSRAAQQLAQRRAREKPSQSKDREKPRFSSATIISRASETGDKPPVKAAPVSPTPPRFRDSGRGDSGREVGAKNLKSSPASQENTLRPSPPKKSKRAQFNPRDLLWSVDQDDSFIRHSRKKTVYSPLGTKNRDHRRRKGLKKTQITIPKASLRVVEMEDSSISVGELARQLSMKAADLIKHLMKDGVMATVNERLDKDTVAIVASQFDYEVKATYKTEEEILARSTPDESSLKPRPPIVTFMGHVDHGKTSLLDVIRKSTTCDDEAGGITQHIGAYMVEHEGGKITFLDTPGHAAFSSIRGRGVKVTDIVVLVVAADDGVMPQTIEAISHAKDAQVPIIVVLNKMDKPSKNLDRIFTELAEHGIQSEEWGGENQFIKMSALKQTGFDELLEAILLQAEMLELKASTEIEPRGVIIEAHMDVGRGAVATIMVSEGVFRVGDEIVAGTCYGRLRAMKNDQNKSIKEAFPSTPMEIVGLSGLPMVGDVVDRVADRSAAKEVVARRREELAKKSASTSTIATLEELIAKVDSEKIVSVPFILKVDTQGSMQAVCEALADIKSDKVKAKIVHKGVGGINASDISLAQVSGSVIMGFNVRAIGHLAEEAEKSGVVIKYFSVIYELIDMAEALLAGSLPPIQNQVVIGRAEIRKLISVPKVGMVAGSSVSDGRIARHCMLRLIRDEVVIHDGKLGSLRRFKDDVKEVSAGYECGISFDDYRDLKEGDVIEAYEIEEVKATL